MPYGNHEYSEIEVLKSAPEKPPSQPPWNNFFDAEGNLVLKNLDTGEKTSVKDLEKPVDPVFLRFATEAEQLSASMTVSTTSGQEKPRNSLFNLTRPVFIKRATFREKKTTPKGSGYVKVMTKKLQAEFENLFLVQALRAHVGPIWALKVNPKGTLLASGGQDAILRVWILSVEGNAAKAFKEEDYMKAFSECNIHDWKKKTAFPEKSFSSSGTYSAASSSKDANGKNDVETGMETREVAIQSKYRKQVLRPYPLREYSGHKLDILDVAWSKNDFLLSASMDKTVRLWHPSLLEALRKFQHNDFITTVSFHPLDERIFISGSLDEKIRLWGIAEKKVLAYKGNLGLVTACAISPDGKHLLVGTYKGQCKALLLSHEEGNHKIEYLSEVEVRSRRGKNSKASKISGICFKPHSKEFLVSSNDCRLRCYELDTLNRTCKYMGHRNLCSQIHPSYSDDGDYVICGSEDRQVYLWNTDPSQVIENNGKSEQNEWCEHFYAHDSIVSVAIFAPKVKATDDSKRERASAIGRVIITAGYSGEVRIFENVNL
eukprot:jgi/Galph1/3227/GphlegSOOS_G1936.1